MVVKYRRISGHWRLPFRFHRDCYVTLLNKHITCHSHSKTFLEKGNPFVSKWSAISSSQNDNAVFLFLMNTAPIIMSKSLDNMSECGCVMVIRDRLFTLYQVVHSTTDEDGTALGPLSIIDWSRCQPMRENVTYVTPFPIGRDLAQPKLDNEPWFCSMAVCCH